MEKNNDDNKSDDDDFGADSDASGTWERENEMRNRQQLKDTTRNRNDASIKVDCKLIETVHNKTINNNIFKSRVVVPAIVIITLIGISIGLNNVDTGDTTVDPVDTLSIII
jgi:hypothetical protein